MATLSRAAGVLMGLLVLGSLITPPAVAAEPGGLRLGDALLYERQVWTPQPDGDTEMRSGHALRIDLLSVETRMDADGQPRTALAVTLTWLQWRHDGTAFAPTTIARPPLTLLVDLASGAVFAAQPYEGVLMLGTPTRPPEISAFVPDGELPCHVAMLGHRLAGQMTPPPVCAGFGVTAKDGGAWEQTAEAIPGYADAERAIQSVDERNSIALWVSPRGPALIQMATSVAYGEEPITAVDYLARVEPGRGPLVSESIAQAQPRAQITPPAEFNKYSPDGPPGGAGFPFSWEAARKAIGASPSAALLNVYLASHPGAAVTRLEYTETPEQEMVARAWFAVWSDAEGTGHAIRVTQRALARGGPALPASVESLQPPEYQEHVHKLGLRDLPSSALTLDSAVDLAVALAPPAAPLVPTALKWITISELDDGTRTMTPAGSSGTFDGWEVHVGALEQQAAPLDEQAASRTLWVGLDGATGQGKFIASEGSGMPLHPLASEAVTPRYATIQDAFGNGETIPRFAAPPTLIVVGLGAGLVLAAVLTSIGREVVTNGLIVPLYARIHGDDTLRHPLRRKLHELIGEKPGIGRAKLVELVGSAEGTIRYHLDVLVTRGFVREQFLDGMTGYSLSTSSPQDAKAKMAARHPHAEAVAAAVAHAQDGVTLREIVDRTGVPQGAAYHHLLRLSGRGIIRVERVGRALRYFPSRLPAGGATPAPVATIP